MVLLSSGIAFGQTINISKVVTGDWNNPASWSQNRIPQDGDSVIIRVGHSINFNATTTIYALNDSGTLVWTNPSQLNISSGGITVTGALSKSSTASIGFTSDNTDNYFINNGSVVIDNIYLFNSDAKLTFNGTSNITLNNNLLFNACSNSEIILESGSISAGGLGASFSNADSNTVRIESSGSLTISGNINFNNFNFTILNYGSITQNGNFQNVASNKVDCHNFENASWNYKGSTYSSNLKLYCNYSNSTFTYSRTGDQYIYTPQDTYWDLELSSGGTKTLRGDIEVKNDIVISDATILDVNSTNYSITLSGNWNHSGTGTFNCQQGTVILDSTTNQSVSTNETFYNLTVNKNSGTVDLDDSIRITGNLTLSDGIIDARTNSGKVILDNDQSNSLYQSSGWIDGELKRKFTSGTGAGEDYFFPVGTGTSLNWAIFN